MIDHYTLDDSTFESQFANGTMNPALFSHEAHLRLAWIHIHQYGVQKAIDHISTQIKAFDQLHGDGTKYHETVTVAAIKAVEHFYHKSTADNFKAFIDEFPRLKSAFKSLIDQHYSWNIFSDEAAKEAYVAPDLEPFDS